MTDEEIELLRKKYNIASYHPNDSIIRQIRYKQQEEKDWIVYQELKEKYPRWFERRKFNED